METGPRTDTLPTRASLLVRLRDLDDSQSWKDFFNRYEQRVTRIAQSKGLNAVEAEDVAQEVFKRVARSICSFETTARPGSFRRWLFNLTRWRATDQLRERNRRAFQNVTVEPSPDAVMSDRTPIVERVPAPAETDAALALEDRQHVVEALLKRVQHCISPKQLQIFQMLVLDEAPAAKVGEVYGMSVAAVYVTKHRVAAKLREEISRLDPPLL